MSRTAATPITSAVTPGPAAATLPLYRLSVEQYRAMARHGILTEDDPVELLHGLLVRKMTKNPPHRVALVLLHGAITAILPAGWHVQSQDPITLSDSEPEPDIAVVRGQVRDYATRHPGPAEVLLVAEVADSSLAVDRGEKKRLYAAEGIAVYWIVNLEDAQVEVHTTPSGPAAQPDYASRTVFAMTDEVPVVLDGTLVGRIPVRDLLP